MKELKPGRYVVQRGDFAELVDVYITESGTTYYCAYVNEAKCFPTTPEQFYKDFPNAFRLHPNPCLN